MMRTGRNGMRSAGIDARNGAPEMRFDAYARRQPVTESSYINSLAIRTYRSTIKTLPATLPEPLAAIQGQGLTVKASRLPLHGRRTGVTGPGCRIWIELGRGVGRRFVVVVPRI